MEKEILIVDPVLRKRRDLVLGEFGDPGDNNSIDMGLVNQKVVHIKSKFDLHLFSALRIISCWTISNHQDLFSNGCAKRTIVFQANFSGFKSLVDFRLKFLYFISGYEVICRLKKIVGVNP
jgi:hypothetical protein